MFENFNPFNLESKDNIMIKIEIKGEMGEEATKEVAKISAQSVAEGKRFFIKCLGIAMILIVVGYFVLQFQAA